MEELKSIMEKFAASGWELISVPAQQWLDGKADKDTLISAIKQADKKKFPKILTPPVEGISESRHRISRHL